MVSNHIKKIYFQDLKDKKILTKKEQLNCTQIIDSLKKKIPKCKNIREEEKIQEEIRKYRDKLILSCTFIVVSIAKKYCNRYMSLFDLIEEGNLALIKGIDTFDSTKNIKFSTYISILVKNKILTAIAHRGKMVRVDTSYQYNSGNFLPITSNRQSPFRTFSKQLGVDSSKIFKVIKNLQQFNLESEQILNQDTFDNFFFQNYSDKDLPEFHLSQKTLSSNIKRIKEFLTDREYQIIEKYYGFNQQKPKRYNAIAKEMNLTSERIRQIHNQAMEKIKNSDLNLVLKDFISDT